MRASFDSIVIGAGLAGIAAAARLSKAGQHVALIEARSRPGGRVWTGRDPGIEHPIELGAEWFGSSGPIHGLLARNRSPIPAASGKHWQRVGVELRDIEELADGGDALNRRLQELDGPDRPMEQALGQCCSEPRYDRAAQMLRNYVSGFHAADPAGVSLEWLLQVEKNQPADASEHRATAGLDTVVHALLGQIGSTCTAFVDTTVSAVRWRTGAVDVDCSSGPHRATLSARHAVVTLPLSILRLPPGAPGAVRFNPALSSKRRAISLLATGPVVKLNLVFDRPFWWDLPGLREMLFVQDFSQPVPTWWSTLPARASLLTGWAAGPQAVPIQDLPPGELKRAAIASLAHALHVPLKVVTSRLRTWHWHDWQRDPFSRGAYTWVRTGGIAAHQQLADPLGRALYFAGEATCGEGTNATMDGAIESGRRAADQLTVDF